MMTTRLVTDYLDVSAAKFPQKIAFADEHREMTFATLKEEAQKIAAGLIQQKFFKQPVAVFLDKSVECIAAFMGIAYSGNFYTPIDIKMPVSRIEKIIATLEPKVIITDRAHADNAADFAHNAKVMLYEELVVNIADESLVKLCTDKIIDSDILYVLFTSGSTGNPKGVIIGHKSVIDYTEWVRTAFEIDDKCIIGNQTPFYFSMSVLDIYQTICNACTMYIIPKEKFAFPIRLLEYIQERSINFIYWVPTALCLVANLRALGKVDISCLRKILFAGEVMPTKQLNMWRRELPNTIFANLFGPTEVTDICNFFVVKRDFNNNEAIPIGEACKNTDIIVVKADGKQAEYGEMGELYVRGNTLAYGYYNNPGKTTEVFVQNPLHNSYPEIVYRTGDLVKYNERGELVYVCRKDFQIKHMGHRIELGEIETAISAIDGIEQSCCVYDSSKDKIVMFFVGSVESEEIMQKLKENLPAYMLPNKKIKLDKMPINLNGKIDRVKLKDMV